MKIGYNWLHRIFKKENLIVENKNEKKGFTLKIGCANITVQEVTNT